MIHAVKLWKAAACTHQNWSTEVSSPQDEIDDFFKTKLDLDYKQYGVDNVDTGDYHSGSNSDEQIAIVIPTGNRGKRNLLHGIVRIYHQFFH